MRLLVFRAVDSEVIKAFLLETLRRSQEAPMNAIFTLRFRAVALEGVELGDLLYIVKLETTFFNFLPLAFFKRMIMKGLRKRGYGGKLLWVKPKEAVILLGDL